MNRRALLVVISVSLLAACAAAIAAASPSTSSLVACVKTDGTVDGVLRTSTARPCPHASDAFVQWSVNAPAPATTTSSSTTTTSHATSTTAQSSTTTSAATSTTVAATTTTTQPATTDPSGQSPPIGDLSGWKQVCVEDFTTPAAPGSWGTTSASKVVYTGANGCKWTEYPDGWSSTNTGGAPGYEPAQVLSVHDSVLDFSLHPINGHAEGANPSPLLPSSSYATSGKFIVRMRADKVSGYHDAFLLWPQNDNDWQSAESDFPEFDLNASSVDGFAHYGGTGSQDVFVAHVDPTQWHTYEQDWSSGKRSYFVDGQLLGTSTNQVYSGPERWQLQTEPSGAAAGGTGHQLIDWAVAYTAS